MRKSTSLYNMASDLIDRAIDLDGIGAGNTTYAILEEANEYSYAARWVQVYEHGQWEMRDRLNAEKLAGLPQHAETDPDSSQGRAAHRQETSDDYCPKCGHDLTHSEPVQYAAATLSQPAGWSSWAECGECGWNDEELS